MVLDDWKNQLNHLKIINKKTNEIIWGSPPPLMSHSPGKPRRKFLSRRLPFFLALLCFCGFSDQGVVLGPLLGHLEATMWGYVEAMLGGIGWWREDFCRARTLSPSSPTKCPDRGVVLGPMLGHLEAVLAKNGGPCWKPGSFWQPECKENPLLTQTVSKLPQKDKPW